jgi:hypothetical protein
MRILHCIPNMTGGGAERQLVYLCRELSRLGHDVHVLLNGKGETFPLLEQTGVTLHFLGVASNYSPRLVYSTAKVVGLVRPDVIQTWLCQMDVVGGIVAVAAIIPWVPSERCSEAAYSGSEISVEVWLEDGLMPLCQFRGRESVQEKTTKGRVNVFVIRTGFR